MRIVFISKPEKAGSIAPDIIEHLRQRGAEVESIVPEEQLFDLQNLDTAADLFVLRTRSTVGLNLAAALEVAGARLLIPFRAERVLRNKFLLHQKLINAGIPVPRSYLLWRKELLDGLLRERGPLVVKPHEGHGGQGVFFCKTAADLAELPDLEGPLFVQEYKAAHSGDIKTYGVGEHVSAIRRVFPAITPEQKRGTPIEPSTQIIQIARRCDAVLQLGLYGVDFIENDDGPMVIDINSFPGYKGIEGAAERIAAYIHDQAARKE